jgi:phosphoribosylaminoimidazole-succinocarboxamide synthase
MERREKLYEGKAKIIYRTDDPDLYVQYFKDDATAFNAQKKGTIVNKGVVNCAVSSYLFEWLAERGVKSHYVRQLGEREMLVKAAEILPIEVVIRNIVAGSLAARMGLSEGQALAHPVVEYYYKRDDLGDPMINEDHVDVFGLARPEELRFVHEQAVRVNTLLVPFLAERRLRLVDFKLEFGRHHGDILLCDEITPDGCRFWDMGTGERLDKDRFRRDLGRVEESYEEVRRRITGGAR